MSDHRPAPRLRWTSERVTRAPIFVVPGESVGSSSVVPRGKTWGIRERGDTGKLVPHSYRCPVHGVFELAVPVSDVPDEVFCGSAETVESWHMGDDGTIDFYDLKTGNQCGLAAPWAGAPCAIGLEPGMVTG